MGWQQQGGFCGRLPKMRLPTDTIYEGSDAATLGSDGAQVGQLLAADGAGGTSWEDPLDPATDNVGHVGTAANRWASVSGVVHFVYATASDAQPSAKLSSNLLSLGLGGSTAPDVALSRGAADRLDLAAGDSLNLVNGTATVNVADAATSAATDLLTAVHTTSGTAAAGFGIGFLFRAQDGAGNTDDQARIASLWTVATSASEESEVALQVRTAGRALETTWTLSADGIKSSGLGRNNQSGNARGARATDLQQYRTAATQVASGADAQLLGGKRNTASAANSLVVGGESNSASTGAFNLVVGGDLNVASGSDRAAVVGGGGNTASGQRSFIGGGEANTASGARSVVPGGGFNVASAIDSVAMGVYAVANHRGELAHSAGTFAVAGDAQTTVSVSWRRATTDATANVELFLNGSSERFTLADDSLYTFDLLISGRRTDANGEAMAHRVTGCIHRNAGTTALVGVIVVQGLADTSGGAWAILVDADDTNDALRIRVTGAANKTIRWYANGTCQQE